MKGILAELINFFSDRQGTSNMNLPLFAITVAVLTIALLICIIVSRKNKLYINNKKVNKDNKDNAYT